jgi:energy-coupling factor transporter ATP-binding protein EcfA2
MMLPQSLVDLLPVPLSAPPGSGASALPTGVEELDEGLLGKGLPRGRLTEIIGARGSGKATLIRHIVGQTLARSGWVACIDASRTLAPRDWAHLADSEELWMIRPTDPARAAWCADVLLRCGAFALVVIDSAPILTRSVAVRLTRLARESGAALVVARDDDRASMLGGAVRLRVKRPEAGARRARSLDVLRSSAGGTRPPPSGSPEHAERRMLIVIEKGGIHRIVEVSCAIGVARRLCAHSQVPDRRGVARRPEGGPGSDRRAAPVALPERGGRGERGEGTPNESRVSRVLPRKRRCAEPQLGQRDRLTAPPLPLPHLALSSYLALG